MKTLEQLALGDLLPVSITGDGEVIHAGMALDPALLDATKQALDLPILSRIDELDEEWVDLLAWQWHVDMYDTSLTLAEKREIVKRALIVHRYKGTLYAVKQALEPFEYDVEIDEHTGEHHVFDAVVEPLNENTDIGVVADRAITYINSAKAVSRHLRNLTLQVTAPATTVYPAAAQVTAQAVTVYPSDYAAADTVVYAGVVTVTDYELEVG